MSKHYCLSCQNPSVDVLLNFGNQPPSNRFVGGAIEDSDKHPLILGQCQNCGLIQLVNPMPAQSVLSRYDWIVYNEPESHLDRMVDDLISLTGLKKNSSILGLTYKDDTTLERFKKRGYEKNYRLSLSEDLKIKNPLAGLETIQEFVSTTSLDSLTLYENKPDLLLVRHVLEHAHNPRKFIQSLTHQVKPGGYMVFEMPESTKFIEACDYSFIWEEHITYHTKNTIISLFQNVGLEVVAVENYSYPLEDSLVVIIRTFPNKSSIERDYVRGLLDIGRRYAEQFDEVKLKLSVMLKEYSDAGKKVALFGAGHLAAKFLNLLETSQFIYAVIDDNQNKSGLHMPGSMVAIKPSSILISEKVDLCLLSLNPESEAKVISKNTLYLESGGEFKSIFRLSKLNFI
jgi:hypothetical protein